MSTREHHVYGEHSDSPDTAARTEESATLQLREEQLEIRKEAIETGQVSVGTDVVEEHRTLQVPVKREEVYIERRPVEGRASAEPISADSDQVIEVALHEEQVSAEKRAVVYEEVEVGRRAVHEQQSMSATLRKEVVDVDAEGDLNVKTDGTSPLSRDR